MQPNRPGFAAFLPSLPPCEVVHHYVLLRAADHIALLKITSARLGLGRPFFPGIAQTKLVFLRAILGPSGRQALVFFVLMVSFQLLLLVRFPSIPLNFSPTCFSFCIVSRRVAAFLERYPLRGSARCWTRRPPCLNVSFFRRY